MPNMDTHTHTHTYIYLCVCLYLSYLTLQTFSFCAFRNVKATGWSVSSLLWRMWHPWFDFSPFEIASGPEKRRQCFSIIFAYGFISAWQSFNPHLLMAQVCSRAMSFRSVPEPMLWFPWHPVLIIGRVPCSLMCPHSQNLLMRLCAVDDGIFKVFPILRLRNIILKLLHNL